MTPQAKKQKTSVASLESTNEGRAAFTARMPVPSPIEEDQFQDADEPDFSEAMFKKLQDPGSSNSNAEGLSKDRKRAYPPASMRGKIGSKSSAGIATPQKPVVSSTQIGNMVKNDIKWNEMFARLCKWKAEHHHCLIPQNYPPDRKLGRWVNYQRCEFWLLQENGTGKINQARIDKLESIGFEWDPHRAHWNNLFDRLVAFKAEHGHARVPKDWAEDKELANWVRNQRLEYKYLMDTTHKQHSRLTEERLNLLESIGFTWPAKYRDDSKKRA